MGRKISLLALVLLCTATVSLASNEKTSALSGSEFQAGRIVDDGVFFEGNGLNASQVQTFLNSKVPVCDTNGTQPYAGTTTGAYSTSKGYPPPFTCMKDYRQDTYAIPADAYCNGFSPGNKSAAEIIYEVGISCGINQKVILITLQKEQSLVTDEWPWSLQYDKATGYACPDTAPCDPDFKGFFKQVYFGARQFKRYAKDSNIFTSYRPYRNNYIQYNPNAGCGGTNVYVQNQATSGLYIYTPYQPNASALNNLYGSGDSCGAYGNRNFWRLFNDWFGTVYAGNYIAQNYSQSSPAIDIEPGQEKTVSFSYKNLGNASWKDGQSAGPSNTYPVYLFTSNPTARASGFSATWPASSRTGDLFARVYESNGTTLAADQHTVYPGQVGVFEFKIKANPDVQTGKYTEYFQPVLSGSAEWNLRVSSSININLVKPYRATPYYADSNVAIKQNEYGNVRIWYKNTGARLWQDSVSVTPGNYPVHLATAYPINRPSGFSATWPSYNRPAKTFTRVYEANGTTLASDQHTVQPGQIAAYEFNMTVPDNLTPSTYPEAFQLVVEGSPYWDMGNILTINTASIGVTRSATFRWQSAYPTLAKGSDALSEIAYRNTGTGSWRDSISATPGVHPVHLATDNPINRVSPSNYMWPSNNRASKQFARVYESNGTALSPDQRTVHPNQIAVFEFRLKNYNLNTNQTTREWFTPVTEGTNRWRMTNQLVWLDVIGQ